MCKFEQQIVAADIFFDEVFCKTKMAGSMEKTVEGSPWHREANVLVHTKMVYTQARQRAAGDWLSENDVNAMLLVGMFHDVGKPYSKIEKEDAVRGKYFAFHGHETVSANMFIDWILDPDNRKSLWFDVTNEMIVFVAFLIQEHLPYDVKKQTLDSIRNTTWYYGTRAGVAEPTRVFAACLMNDTCGRISDNMEEKVSTAETWCNTIWNDSQWTYQLKITPDTYEPVRQMIVPIGATGAGKSVWTDAYFEKVRAQDPNVIINVCNSDIIRYNRFKDEVADDVDVCLKNSNESDPYRKRDIMASAVYRAFYENDVDFEALYTRVLNDAIHKKQNVGCIVIVDRTNLTQRVQRRYAQLGRAKKMHVKGVVFMRRIDTHKKHIRARYMNLDCLYVDQPSDHLLYEQYYARMLPLIGDMNIDSVEFVF